MSASPPMIFRPLVDRLTTDFVVGREIQTVWYSWSRAPRVAAIPAELAAAVLADEFSVFRANFRV